MRVNYLWVCLVVVCAATLLADDDQRKSSSEKESRYSKKSTDFKLTIRSDNGAYKKAAYSFRFATQDVKKHRNLVDLVYNRCRQLHVNAHGGMRSRIVDLGEVDFKKNHQPPNRGWRKHSIQTQKNHVYIQEINDGKQKSYVKFLIADIERDGTLKVKWASLDGDKKKFPKYAINPGQAGTLGQCGGYHQER